MLPIYPSSICLYVPSIHLPTSPSIYLSINLFTIHLHIHKITYHSISHSCICHHLFICHLSIYPCIHPCIHLIIHPPFSFNNIKHLPYINKLQEMKTIPFISVDVASEPWLEITCFQVLIEQPTMPINLKVMILFPTTVQFLRVGSGSSASPPIKNQAVRMDKSWHVKKEVREPVC